MNKGKWGKVGNFRIFGASMRRRDLVYYSILNFIREFNKIKFLRR